MSDNDQITVPSPPRIERIVASNRTLIGLDWRNKELFELNALNTVFENCDFRYSVFDSSYLRNATFKNCRFDGARFVECNLRNASFYKCDFKYVLFRRTLVDPKELVAALPAEPNIRKDALQNLRANAVEVGDFASIGFLVLQEIEASKRHLLYAATAYDTYYREKYPRFLDRAKARAKRWALILEGLVWGHGERPARLFLSCSLLLFLIALANLWSVVPRTGWDETLAGLNVLRYVIDLFLDLPADRTFRGWWFLDYAVVALRYVYIGLFVAVLFKVVSHR